MLGAKRFKDRQRAFEERPRPHEVALSLQQLREVNEARRRITMVGPAHLLMYRQCIAKKGESLGVNSAPVKIAPGVAQKHGPACNVRSGIRGGIAHRQQVWRELRGQRPGLRDGEPGFWVERSGPCRDSV